MGETIRVNGKVGYYDIPAFKRDEIRIDRYLSSNEAAEKLGISTPSFLKLMKKFDKYIEAVVVPHSSRTGKGLRWSDQKIDWLMDNIINIQDSVIKKDKMIAKELQVASYLVKRVKKSLS